MLKRLVDTELEGAITVRDIRQLVTSFIITLATRGFLARVFVVMINAV